MTTRHLSGVPPIISEYGQWLIRTEEWITSTGPTYYIYIRSRIDPKVGLELWADGAISEFRRKLVPAFVITGCLTWTKSSFKESMTCGTFLTEIFSEEPT